MRMFRDALALFAVLAALTGIVYPLAFTGIAQVICPGRAGGSLIRKGEEIVGSKLIGQPFTDPGYFRSRPSATGSFPYNAGISSGSNLGPLSADLASAVGERVRALRSVAGADSNAAVPVDLVTASGSGLDPEISPAAAYYQISRVARWRGLPEDEVRALVTRLIKGRQLGFLGEPRVNVLELNLALDEMRSPSTQ